MPHSNAGTAAKGKEERPARLTEVTTLAVPFSELPNKWIFFMVCDQKETVDKEQC